MRLVAVVLVTGVLGFGIIGGLTALRLHQQLNSQADALGHLSERQLAHRLDGEAQLARARIEALGADAADRLRQLAQRADVGRAVGSRNDVTIQELLTPVAKTSGFERLIALDETGRVIGANATLDLLAVNAALQDSEVAADLKPLLQNNSRSHPRGHQDTGQLEFSLMSILKMPVHPTVAHMLVEPVFDDFGDLIGALFAIRPIGQSERTLESFTSLADAGVAILHDNEVVSAAGPRGVTFTRLETKVGGLQHSDDSNYVARCVDYETAIRVCVFTDAAVISTARDQMFQIGAAQARALMGQFLASAALALGALVAALLVVVRHTTKGLSTLAAAAQEIAGGNLDVPFRATGIGEVRSLETAFERMLSNLRASTRKIRQLAFYDAISQLPNREKIRDDAPGVIASSGCGALFFLDLDGFKSINDTFGHKAGDALLRKVAERLTKLLAAAEDAVGKPLLARIGGDEFAAILPGISAVEEASEAARGVIETLRAPFNFGGDHASVGTSIGIAMYPADGTTYEDLLVNADLAMYAAKSSGRNTYAFFAAELAETARARQAFEHDLASAIRNEELSVQYQPKVSCSDGRIRGVEAIVRWAHPALGNFSPERFVTIAEETGLIGDIDRFVLKRALGDIGDLIRGGSDIVLAVNVTATEIEDPLFIKHIVKSIREAHFPPTRLELEITESVAMRNPKLVCERITLLRQLGIRIALDDFGAGYSNLATMARLPFDSVKLDRSMVSGVAGDQEKQMIVRIAIRLASELGFETVAEGVESAEDLHFVAENGATMVQGSVFSPPLPLAEFSALVQPSRLLSPIGSSPGQPALKARKRASWNGAR
ncbi:diguanylate cyclase (GGDEF) domain-containing protein [Rhizobiales bacterium GAS191]|nr:diguanylate cyclase (GGDEF) domain-containing protein [Rhizobiales bacterium GAS191]